MRRPRTPRVSVDAILHPRAAGDAGTDQQWERDGSVPEDLEAQTVAEFIVYGFERLTAQHIATAPASTDKKFARSISEVGWRLIYGSTKDLA